MVAAIGLELLILLFPVYVHQFMSDYVGQLGFVIIVLLLFYVLGLIFVLGAQINAFFFESIQPLPVGLGSCLSDYAEREHMQLINDNGSSFNPLASSVGAFEILQ